MNRRGLLVAMVAAFTGAVVLADTADATIRRRRRIRRRIRRRMRRRIVIRTLFGRPFWVVPVGMVAGWELVHADRVVVVKETKFVERDGNKVEVATVQDSSGKTEQIEITREDIAENSHNELGSILPASDHSTPGVDDEIEEEVET